MTVPPDASLQTRTTARVTDAARASEPDAAAAARRLALIGEHSTDVLCEMRDGVLTYVSPNSQRGSGLTAEQFVGKPFAAFVHPDDLAAHARYFALGWTGPIEAVFRLRVASGGWQWREARGARVIDADGAHRAVLVLRDIDDRHRAEEALRLSEAGAKALSKAIPDLMFSMTRDGTCLNFKADRSEDLYVAPERIIGGNIRDLLPAEVHEPILLHIARALDEGGVHTLEYSLLKKAGMRDYEARITASGEDEVVAICRDITEQRRLHDALHSSEERLRLIFHNAPLIVFAIDAAGTITAADGKALEAVDLRAEDLIGFSAFELYADAPETLSALRQALTGDPVTLTASVRGVVWHSHLEPVYADDSVTGVIGVAVNLSDRVRAELALAESEEKYRLVVEEARDLVYAHDLAGNIIEVNPAGLAMFGYTADEIHGMSFAKVIDPAYVPIAIANMQRALNGEDMLGNLEFLARAKDGSARWLEITPAPVRRAGEIVGFRGIARNITDRKRAEAEVRQAEERTTLFRERQRIAQELHDNVAQYFFGIGMAAKGFDDASASPEGVHARLEHIQRLSAEGGHEIRRAIRALSSGVEGDLDTRLAALLDPLRTEGIACTYTRAGSGDWLSGPHDEEVVAAARELVFNARKHARARSVSIELRSEDHAVSLVVGDDGVGAADQVTRAIERRSGFGLPNLDSRLRAAGGLLLISDSDGGGVTVTVRFEERTT